MISKKDCACSVKGATSPRCFDKATEMGRKGKLARGRTKGIHPLMEDSLPCQGTRNAETRKLTSERERKHAV